MSVLKVKKDSVWEEVGGISDHTHTTTDITNFPSSLPADGGNADTVDGKHASDFAAATDMTTAQSDISDLQTKVGDLSGLNTVDKSSLVAAINEAAKSGGGGAGIVIDSTLTKSGQAADAKATGDRLAALSEEKVTLPKDTDGNIIPGAVGWYAVSDGAGGITWVESAPSTGGETTHGIVWDLVNVTSSNNAVSVSDGASLVAVLTPADGYTLGDVTITMGGEVLTDVWNADTSTVTIPSVTGDVIITCIATEQSGGEVLDTSPVIASTGVELTTTGTTKARSSACITDFYDLGKTLSSSSDQIYIKFQIAYKTNDGGSQPRLQVWNDDTFATYWTTQSTNSEQGVNITGGYGTCNRVRFTLFTDGIDDSYAYFASNGNILFAGKNTQYYGMTNINGSTSGESAVSVAAEVDNQVAMMSLSMGETVDTSAYSGLSSDYVAMVQANYDAMMTECLGDYNKIPLIIHTDQHGRIGASNQIMKLIGDMVNWYEVSKCINLGDTVTDRFGTTELENYLSATKDSIPLSKRLDIYGNHDIWDADDDQKYTVNQKRLSPYFKNIYARRQGNNGYFTVVDDYYNVKYLVINNMEYPDTNYQTKRITTAQANFIISELSADDGRDVVILSHTPFDSDEVTSRDSTYLAYSEKFLSSSTAHNSFMAMIAARKNKTSGTFTDSEGVEHSYDFSSVSGNLLMSLHGHAHFEAYRTFENSITEFIFDWFDGNTFYFAYIDREEKKFKVWKNEADVEALEISIA